MSDSTVLLAALGIVSACVGALIYVIKFMFQKIVPLLESLTISTDKNTKATKKADEYLRERNGRDNEFHGEVMKGLKAIQTAVEVK